MRRLYRLDYQLAATSALPERARDTDTMRGKRERWRGGGVYPAWEAPSSPIRSSDLSADTPCAAGETSRRPSPLPAHAFISICRPCLTTTLPNSVSRLRALFRHAMCSNAKFHLSQRRHRRQKVYRHKLKDLRPRQLNVAMPRTHFEMHRTCRRDQTLDSTFLLPPLQNRGIDLFSCSVMSGVQSFATGMMRETMVQSDCTASRCPSPFHTVVSD